MSAFASYGFGPPLSIASGVIGAIPTSGANAIVLLTFDNDGNSATSFGAGNAANLIAQRVTSHGAGVFIYFNSALDLPRLVFSTDLNDPTSDLKVLARFTNLGGAAGQVALGQIGPANFATAVPEPSTLLLLGAGLACMTLARRRSRAAATRGTRPRRSCRRSPAWPAA